jgi:hypothetical protein
MTMNRFVGQVLRMLGLLVEMLGILGLALYTGTDETGAELPGSLSTRLIWGVIALGFVVWLTGTVMTYWPTGSASTPRGRDPRRPEGPAMNL